VAHRLSDDQKVMCIQVPNPFWLSDTPSKPGLSMRLLPWISRVSTTLRARNSYGFSLMQKYQIWNVPQFSHKNDVDCSMKSDLVLNGDDF
jgi:hypothetical protein